MDPAALVKCVVNKETHYKTTEVLKHVDVELDVGHLSAYDPNSLNTKELKNEFFLDELNRGNVQLLMNAVWDLPSERNEDVVVVPLPVPSTKIPREKPLPKPKQETRWEAFAKLKGIKKKKKEKMVWDEVHREFRPAWGYRKANDKAKQWLIEVPDNANPYEDPYQKLESTRQERVAKNEYQRLRNIAKSSKSSSLPSKLTAPSEKPSKEQLSNALAVAKQSTASGGKFTKALPKEDQVKKPKSKKRKFDSNTGSISDERSRQLTVLHNIGTNQPQLNTKMAIRKTQMEDSNSGRMPREKPSSKRLAKRRAAMDKTKKKRGARKKGQK